MEGSNFDRTSTTERRMSDEDEDLFPIPCSRETFERITTVFILPKSYLEILHRGTTVFLQFPPGYNETSLDARGMFQLWINRTSLI
jgi:hypothetical protein